MKKNFITFEGIDGCGKTTQANLLAEHFQKKGENTLLVREPGGTPISDQIRKILLNPGINSMSPETETFLIVASRSQLTREVILPGIKKGITIISDRYSDSTLAYQGYGRNLPLDWLQQINEKATGGLTPDITLLIDLPVEIALERLSHKRSDRMEKEGKGFLEKVRNGYLSLAEKYHKRYIVIDGSLSSEEIHLIILKQLKMENP